MNKWFKQLLQTVFKIEPGEYLITLLMFVYLLCATGAFIVSRITRDVIFMDIANFKAMLPYTYMAVAVSVSSIMALYAKIERCLRRDHTNLITLAVLIAVMLGSNYFLTAGNSGDWFKWFFYIFVELAGSFLIVQFWSLANEIFYSRQAKRLFAFIGAGGILANIVAGFGVKALAKNIGTNNMTLVIAALMAIAMLMVFLIAKVATEQLERPQAKISAKGNKSQKINTENSPIFASKHLKTIAMIVVITYLVSTMVDFQFKTILADAIPAADDRSAFYGLFFGLTGILSASIQLFLTGRILQKFGVLFSLLILPVAMLGGSCGLLVFPVLASAVFTKGSENVLRYTITDATMQLLYLPVPAAQRGRAKAFIDGVLKPLATGGAGLILLMITSKTILQLFNISKIDFRFVTFFIIILLILWCFLLFRLKGEYINSLLNTLQKRRLDFSDTVFNINDENTLNVINNALKSDKLGYVLHAFELLSSIDKPNQAICQTVISLLNHSEPNVRIAALNYLTVNNLELPVKIIKDHFEDESEEVRAAAIRAYCSRLKEHAVQDILVFLDDSSPLVKGSAVSALIRFGGLDGILHCAETLKAMLTSPEAATREKGAWILGDINVRSFYQPLIPLFKDQNPKVRSAALEAAGKLRAPELVPNIIEQLANHSTSAMAIAALTAYGPEIETQLLEKLTAESTAMEIREMLPRILTKIGSGSTIKVFESLLDNKQTSLRNSALRALVKILAIKPALSADENKIRDCINLEIKEFYNSLSIENDLQLRSDIKSDILLYDTFHQRRIDSIERLFYLLNILYPGNTLEIIFHNLQSSQASIRSNALELLDNIIDNNDKALILPLLENRDLQKLLNEAPFKLTSRSAKERLTELLNSPDNWLCNCTLFYIGIKKLAEFKPLIQNLQLQGDPIVRQTALWALSQFLKAGNNSTNLLLASQDSSLMVSDYARFLKQEGQK